MWLCFLDTSGTEVMTAMSKAGSYLDSIQQRRNRYERYKSKGLRFYPLE
jgi:hypothetical protein